MRQMFSGLAAVVATVALGVAPAMACGGDRGLFTSSCSPCGQVFVSPCGQSFHGGFGHVGFSHYQRLADPSPRYFWVDQGPAYDGPGQFAPRPYYRERTVTGWSEPGVSGWGGGPAVGVSVRRSHHRVRTAHVNYGANYGVRWHSTRHDVARPGVRHAPARRYGEAAPRHYGEAAPRSAPRAMRGEPGPAPRFRDSGNYSYRSGFRDGSSR